MHAIADNLNTESKVNFLVGAGRSGTTLLYKLLCLHPEIAYISNYENHLKWFPDGVAARFIAGEMGAKLNAWFKQGGNAYFVKRPWAKRIFPTPNEGESVYESCGLPLFTQSDYIPDDLTRERLRRRFERIRKRAGAQIFLSKRTANNRRITQLRSVFPQARYIHLIRDGREVAQSLSHVEWWDDHTVWWDGRTALQMEQAGEERLTICARNWAYEMSEIRKQLAQIANGRVLEIRFEELLSDPVSLLESILNFLGLSWTSDYWNAVNSLELAKRPPAWVTSWTAEDLACVLREEHPILSELGYTS